MVLRDGEEVVDGGDVVDGVGQDADLVHPRVPEDLDVLLGNLAPRPRRQNPGGVDHLRTQVLDLRGGVAHHLDALIVVRHGAGQVGDLDELVGVLGEDLRALLHLGLLPLLRGRHQHHQRPRRVQETVRHVVDDRLPQLSPQVPRLLGHVRERPVQLLGRPTARVVEVLSEQVLQRLPHRVALRHDPLLPLVPRAARVGHQRRARNDGLQPLLEARPRLRLVVVHRVHQDVLVKVIQGGRERPGALEARLARPRGLALRDVGDGVDGLADLLEHKVPVGLGGGQLRVAHVGLARREQHHGVLLEDGPRGGQVVAHRRVLQLVLPLPRLVHQILRRDVEAPHRLDELRLGAHRLEEF